MTSELANAKYSAELGYIDRYLTQAGYACNLLDSSAELPVPILIAALPKDEAGRDRFFHFVFVPVEQEELRTLEFLQVYGQMPFQVDPAHREVLEKFLLYANEQIVLGQAGLGADGTPHLRYILSKEQFRLIDQALITELVQVLHFIFDQLSPLVEQVGTGQLGAQEALDQLRAA
jgi:hypothetical protein